MRHTGHAAHDHLRAVALRHPAVQSDFNAAIAYYEAEGGVNLADRFEAEFRACLAAIKSGPTHHPHFQVGTSYRRIRLKNFPYLILY